MRSFDGYRHREAFCLMKYAAEDDSEVEWIWNSRDGITPFCVSNRAGDKMLKHVDWHLDRRILGYQPMPCDRVFVNLSPQRAREALERKIEHYWDQGSFTRMRDFFGTKENALEMTIASYLGIEPPDLVEFGSLSSPNNDTSSPSQHK